MLIGKLAASNPQGSLCRIGGARQGQRQRCVQRPSQNSIWMGEKVVGDGLPSQPSGPDLALEQIPAPRLRRTDGSQFNYRGVGKLAATHVEGFAELTRAGW